MTLKGSKTDNLIEIKGNFSKLSQDEYLKVYATKEEKQFDFRNIQRINKYLGFQGADNLWYIFHPVAKSSFGPCSSENLQEMYNAGMLDGQSELRFIDVYCLRNTEPFSFFKLKDMESQYFLKKIEPSTILKKAIKVPIGFPTNNLDSRKMSANTNNEENNSRKISNNIEENESKSSQVLKNLENDTKPINNNINKVNKPVESKYKFTNNNNTPITDNVKGILIYFFNIIFSCNESKG